MTIYDILLEKFKTDDDRLYFEAKQSFSLKALPRISFFKTLIKAVSERDKIIINLTNDAGRELRIDNVTQNDVYIDFISDSDQIDVTISINKNVLNHTLSIFNYNKFIDNLSKLDNTDFLNFLSSIITSNTEYIFFEVYDNDMLGKAYRTETIFFKYYEDKCFECSKIDRLELFSKVLFTNNFFNLNEFPLLPNDFHIVSSEFDSRIKELFQKWEILFSFIYLASFSFLHKEKLNLSKNATKNITDVININQFSFLYTKEIYDIFSWIYHDDIYLDKLTIAREVIESSTFHFSDLKLSVRDISRAYNLYIKNNVSEYLSAKKDIGDFIVHTLYEMDQYRNVIIGSFSNNFVALVAFITTTMIANIVSDSPLDNIFSKDILWLLLFALLGSLIYCYLSNKKFNKDITDFNKVFERLKNNYKDILTEEDIGSLFSESEFKQQVENISEIRLNINIIWIISSVVLIFLTVFALYKKYV